MAEQRERWGGRLPFIMAAIGSAVGLGNVWRFPFVAFKNGGGAFFIPYFVALITAGIPLMILEYSLGQKFQKGAPGAMAKIGKGWRWVGWFAIFVGVSISFYYCQIMALSWHYMFASTTQSWNRPVDDRTLFHARYRVYHSDFDKTRIEGELKRSKQSHVRLVPAADESKVKEILTRDIKEEWGQDTDVYTTVDDVLGYAKTYLHRDKTAQPSDPKTRFVVLADADLETLKVRLAEFYMTETENHDAKAGPDDELGLLEEDRIRIIPPQANHGIYFEETALGGFGTGLGQWSRATKRNALIDGALDLLEDPQSDLSRLWASPTEAQLEAVKKGEADPDPDWQFRTQLPGLSKHAAKAYAELQAAHRTLADQTDPPKTDLDRLFEARADLATALNAKTIDAPSPWRPVWHLVFWAGLTWLIIFLIIFKGVHVVGKVVMFTVPAPVIILGVLIVHGLFLNGSSQGIAFFLNPDWGLIQDPGVWVAAYGQIFFSLSLGFGIMIAYASYLPKDSDVSNNAFMTAFGNCCTSFYASFAVFSVLGYLAMALNAGVGDVVKGGPGLVFTTYPVALSEMGGMGAVVGFLFFFSLLTLGIDSGFSIVEAFITGLRDSLPQVDKTVLTGAVCLIGFLATCVYCTRSGLMWLDIVDNWMNNYGLPFVGLLECIAVGYFFNIEEIRNFVNERSEIRLSGWWDACVKVVTPLILFVILFQQVLTDLAKPYGGYDQVLPYAVNLGGWGYFAAIILASFLITRSWVHIGWTATAVLSTLVMWVALDLPASHAVLGGVGFTLLFAGLATCILVSRKGVKAEPPPETPPAS